MIQDRTPCVVTTMGGFGDCLYTRPFVRAYARFRPTWVRTAWPELYDDLPVKGFVPLTSWLRCSQKNLERQERQWQAAPVGAWETAPGYSRWCLLADQYTTMEALERFLPLSNVPGEPFVFDLPANLPVSPVRSRKPVAVIRPVTIRIEWPNIARNCDPVYMRLAAEELVARGYHVVSVADIDPDHEPADGELPFAHKAYHRGELGPRELLALIRDAAVVVGSVGWILPACVAARTPLILVRGGQAGFNRPEILIDPRMDDSLVQWIGPPDICTCTEHAHRCNKLIPEFPEKFAAALDRVPQLRAVAA